MGWVLISIHGKIRYRNIPQPMSPQSCKPYDNIKIHSEPAWFQLPPYDSVSPTVYSRNVKKIDGYIFRQLFATTLFVAIALTSEVWLTQSLRFVEMIVNRGLSVSLFMHLTLLLVPSFLAIILPIALFVAVLFVYNRLLVDSELVVLRTGGCSQYSLAMPAVTLSLVVMLVCSALTFYVMPAFYRDFKDLQFTLRNSLPTVLLQEGVFSPVMKGVTVYVGSRSREGDLSEIIIHDARNRGQPITMMAERGSIISGESGPRVILITGSRQQVDENNGSLTLLYFDRYNFDLSTVQPSPNNRWREPRERFLTELFFSEDKDNKVPYFHKLRMEGHHRISLTLLPTAFVLTALAFLLGGGFNRRGQLYRIMSAISVVVLIEIAQVGAKNLGEKTQGLFILMYLAPLIPAIVSAWFLSAKSEIKLKAFLAIFLPKVT
jgi:lipopolysaccharide export system permease protein